jgi:hypothetical protein
MSAETKVVRMSDAEYRVAQDVILALGSLISAPEIDFDALLDRIAIAESVGSIVDPTLYRRGVGRLEAFRDFAIALRGARDAANTLRQVIGSSAEVDR